MTCNCHLSPMSILQFILVHLWLVLDSNLVNSTYLTMSIFTYLTLTTAKCWSWSSSVCWLVSPSWCTSFSILSCQLDWSLCDDLQIFLKWLSLLHFPHFFPYPRYCPGECPVPRCLHLSSHGASCTCRSRYMPDGISLWPLWYCLACFFVPSAPPPCVSNLACVHTWLLQYFLGM